MSTRAAIGIAQADGTIKAIYLHNDGYPGFAGAILAGWYNTAEKAEALIALGALSSIGEKLNLTKTSLTPLKIAKRMLFLPTTGTAAKNYAPATPTKIKSITNRLPWKISGQTFFTFSAMGSGFFTASRVKMNGSGLKQKFANKTE